MIEHYPSCTAKYPEKVEEESAQAIAEIETGEHVIRQCADCGAFETCPLETRS